MANQNILQRRHGGLIVGPGTGTSDDVPGAVPKGTFIMPADSTKAIGEENLDALGDPRSARGIAGIMSMYNNDMGHPVKIDRPGLGMRGIVPAHFSNGEFAVPPEKLQAIGAQVMDGMKAATHTQTDSPIERKGGLYFANGGLVGEDPNKLKPTGSAGYAGSTVGGAGKDMTGALDSATQQAQATPSVTTPAAPSAPGATTTTPASTQPSPSKTGYAGSATGGSNDLTNKLDSATKQAQGATGFQSATKPIQPGETGVEMIGGIRHSTTPAVGAGQTAGAIGSAMGQTANNMTGGAFDFEGRAEQNRQAQRSELNPQTAPTSNLGMSTFNKTPGQPTTNLGMSTFNKTPSQPTANLGFDPNSFSAAQRSAAADAYGAGIDRATGTGLGFGAGSRLDEMQKRFAAYQSNPDVLAMRNAREDLLGSGINIQRGPNGLNITNTGNTQGTLAAAGGSSINMNEGNAAMARANATRQSMTDTPEIAAKLAAERSSNAAYDAKYGGRDPRLVEGEATSARWAQERQMSDIMNIQGRNKREAAIKAMGISQGADNARMANETAMRGQDIAATGNQQRNTLDQARLGIDQQRIAQGLPAAEGQGIQNQQASLMLDLQKRAAGGDEKAMATLRGMNGKTEPSNRFTVVPGGQEWDAGANAMRNVPGRVLNNQTGQFMEQPGQQQGASGADKNRAIGTTSRVGDRLAVWDGSKWVEQKV